MKSKPVDPRIITTAVLGIVSTLYDLLALPAVVTNWGSSVIGNLITVYYVLAPIAALLSGFWLIVKNRELAPLVSVTVLQFLLIAPVIFQRIGFTIQDGSGALFPHELLFSVYGLSAAASLACMISAWFAFRAIAQRT